MTLVSSGDLFIGGDVELDTKSIQFEAEGSKAGAYSLVEAAAAAGDCVGALPVSITDFYGWENALPAVPISCLGQEAPLTPGEIEVLWNATTPPLGDGVWLEYTRDMGIIAWTGTMYYALTIGGEPFAGTVPAGWYKCRAWAENCTGTGSIRESARFYVTA